MWGLGKGSRAAARLHTGDAGQHQVAQQVPTCTGEAVMPGQLRLPSSSAAAMWEASSSTPSLPGASPPPSSLMPASCTAADRAQRARHAGVSVGRPLCGLRWACCVQQQGQQRGDRAGRSSTTVDGPACASSLAAVRGLPDPGHVQSSSAAPHTALSKPSSGFWRLLVSATVGVRGLQRCAGC